MVRLAARFERVECVGVNCTSPLHISELLEGAQAALQLCERQLMFAVYPNSGEVYNAKTGG